MKTPLILVDGSSYFFRAFHALPPLTTSKGQPTGAIYGVANMVRRLIKDYQPTHIAVVFDAPGKTFRDEWFSDYKAHRPPTPTELTSQFQPLIEFLTAMGLPLLTIEGVEADDVIGTLAAQATAAGMDVLISTGDKDMAQLVNEHVTLINTMSNQRLNIEGVQEKFGVLPEQMIDYLSLIGDSSDNIPGIPQCGPKTAIKWLTTYSTLENLILHAHEISGKIGESLRNNLDNLALAKKLVKIKTDVALPYEFSELVLQSSQRESLIALTRELEFKNWLKELLIVEESQPTPVGQTSQFELITTHEQLATWLDKLKSCSLFCINAETTDLDVMRAEIVGLALAIHPNQPAYIPLQHIDGTTQLDYSYVLEALKPILENPKIGKVGRNLKYDYCVFKNHGITLEGIRYDTMLESYLLNSTSGRHDMDSLALKYLGRKAIALADIAGTGSKQLRFNQISVTQAAPYAAEDAEINLKLHETLYPMLPNSLHRVLHELEIPLLTVLGDMECHGVLIDDELLIQHGQRLKEKIALLEQEAYQLAGRPFNLASPKQLQEILYQELQLPMLSKTPKGQPSTAESALQELAFDYRLPAVILEHRGLSKLVSTYIDALPRAIHPKTNRVHTSYNQAITSTGRLSSSNPNLQNIPIRSEEGRLVRKAFIAPPNYVLLAADYSQIELRIMAHLSQDENLLKAFANDWDIHSATASEIFAVPLDQISAEQRRRAKAVNFGLIYGMSAFGLAKQIGVERHVAQFYIDRYFERYPSVRHYMDRTRAQARQQGYIETLLGRRLYLPEINTQNLMRRKAAERAAINAPMQGTAADIIKQAMINIAAWQEQDSTIHSRMIMQVHDELVFEVPETEISIASHTIREYMEHCVKLAIPLKVSMGWGKNWEEAHA